MENTSREEAEENMAAETTTKKRTLHCFLSFTYGRESLLRRIISYIGVSVITGYLQASRALMISALVFGLFSCLSGMVGLQCTKVAEENSVLKGKFATVAGALSIFAGICAGISVSWYAFNITAEFFNPLYPGTKYEIGPALYLGWSGALLNVVGGSLLCCSFKTQVVEAKKGYTYNYRGATTATSAKAAPQTALPRYESSNSISKYGKNAYV
ncbi:PREDICTED: claudin-15-like [Nanorana parkeri]|uniref:claudin-15-like n=1 Tax=Nanorana parkeri TaxID=125878 RepID=UPI0008540DD0|nr:PREDICTED: claudin-15-like [Nanorana parkeri]